MEELERRLKTYKKSSLVWLLDKIIKEYPQIKYQLIEMFKEIDKIKENNNE